MVPRIGFSNKNNLIKSNKIVLRFSKLEAIWISFKIYSKKLNKRTNHKSNKASIMQVKAKYMYTRQRN